MALTNVPVVASATTPKQIAVRAVTGVMYTVPAGKTFTGVVPVTMGNGCEIFINGVNILSLAPTTPYFGFNVPLNLTAGTVVSSGGSYLNWSILGVEQ